MNKKFIFSIIFLGLIFGKVECGEKSVSSGEFARAMSKFLVVGWMANSTQRLLSGKGFQTSYKDAVYFYAPLIMSLSSDESMRKIGDMGACLNTIRILGDIVVRLLQESKVGTPPVDTPPVDTRDTGTQTDPVVIAGPWHRKDTRDYLVDVERLQLYPNKKK